MNSPACIGPPGLTDDEIETLALKHIAPGYDRLRAIIGECAPYQHSDQFLRIKALLTEATSKMRAEGAPQASAEPVRILFPAHLRRMWSGGEVQAWLDEHQGVAPSQATARGSLQRYRQWKADQAAPACSCPSGDGSLRLPCAAHPAKGPEAGDA